MLAPEMHITQLSTALYWDMEETHSALVMIFIMFDFKLSLSFLTGPANAVSIFSCKIHFLCLMKAFLFFFTLSLFQMEVYDPQ